MPGPTLAPVGSEPQGEAPALAPPTLLGDCDGESRVLWAEPVTCLSVSIWARPGALQVGRSCRLRSGWAVAE